MPDRVPTFKRRREAAPAPRLWACSLVLVATLALPEAAAALPAGPLTLGQLHGRDGCLSRTSTGGRCFAAPALDPGSLNAQGAVAVSPDGGHAYAAAAGRGAIVIFRRDRGTGQLRWSGCIAAGGGGGCAPGQRLEAVSALAVSPDGANVYATSARGGAVAIFRRNAASGALTQSACRPGGVSPGCATSDGLSGASDGTVSQDGRQVYVAAKVSGTVTVFARDQRNGALARSGCVGTGAPYGCDRVPGLVGANAVSLAPGGRLVYVTASNAVVVFARDPGTGALRQRTCASAVAATGCARWRHLEDASSAAPSPDGRHLYVTANISNAVTDFRVGAGGERLSPIGCTSADGAGVCVRGYGLNGASAVSVGPDGRRVYVASKRFSNGVALFRRNARTGRLRELGCITRDRAGRACAKGTALGGATTAALSPDGRNVYVLATERDAIAVFRPDIGIVGRRWIVRRSGRVRLRLACPSNATGRCRGILELRTVQRVRTSQGRRRLTVGRARFSVAPGSRRFLRVYVARRFRPLLRRPGGLRVRPLTFPIR